jgi:hypothetical protein
MYTAALPRRPTTAHAEQSPPRHRAQDAPPAPKLKLPMCPPPPVPPREDVVHERRPSEPISPSKLHGGYTEFLSVGGVIVTRTPPFYVTEVLAPTDVKGRTQGDQEYLNEEVNIGDELVTVESVMKVRNQLYVKVRRYLMKARRMKVRNQAPRYLTGRIFPCSDWVGCLVLRVAVDQGFQGRWREGAARALRSHAAHLQEGKTQ